MLYTMRSPGADKVTAWFWLKSTVLMAFLILLNDGSATEATPTLPMTQDVELQSYMTLLSKTFPEKVGEGHTIGETEKVAAKFYSSVFASHPHPFEEKPFAPNKAFVTKAKHLTEYIKSIFLESSDVDLNAVLQVFRTVIAATTDPIEGYQRIFWLYSAFGLFDPETNSFITNFINKHEVSYTQKEMNFLTRALKDSAKTDTEKTRIAHSDVLIEQLEMFMTHAYKLPPGMLGNDKTREKYNLMGPNMFWMLLQMLVVHGKMCKTAHNEEFANKLVKNVDDLLARFPK